MGLSIHFKLRLPSRRSEHRIEELVATASDRARQLAKRRRLVSVGPVTTASENMLCATRCKSVRLPGYRHTFTFADIPPLAGFLFTVDVGEDCEPLTMGLCRYPAKVTELRTGSLTRTLLATGWRFSRFCKTQFASIHGWEHFRRCHLAVIDLILIWQELGVGVEINDEGEYWPRRSLSALRRNLDEMNGVVAAAADALKDMNDAAGATGQIESPIFSHPQFERLEAKGQPRIPGELRRVLKKLGGQGSD